MGRGRVMQPNDCRGMKYENMWKSRPGRSYLIFPFFARVRSFLKKIKDAHWLFSNEVFFMLTFNTLHYFYIGLSKHSKTVSWPMWNCNFVCQQGGCSRRKCVLEQDENVLCTVCVDLQYFSVARLPVDILREEVSRYNCSGIGRLSMIVCIKWWRGKSIVEFISCFHSFAQLWQSYWIHSPREVDICNQFILWATWWNTWDTLMWLSSFNEKIVSLRNAWKSLNK